MIQHWVDTYFSHHWLFVFDCIQLKIEMFLRVKCDFRYQLSPPYFIQDSQIIFAKCSVCSFLTELFLRFANIWYLLCGLFAISSSSTLWTRSEIPTENKWTAFFSRSSAALSLVNSTPRVLYPSVKNTATRFTPKQIKQIISNYICVVCFLHFLRLYSIQSKKRQQSKINLARNSLKIRENREKEHNVNAYSYKLAKIYLIFLLKC